MRLTDRGLIRDGMWADAVVFDYNRIQDRATYEEPTLYPDGIEWVLVNGELAVDRGRHTGARSGRVIYGPGRTIPPSEADTRVASESEVPTARNAPAPAPMTAPRMALRRPGCRLISVTWFLWIR